MPSPLKEAPTSVILKESDLKRIKRAAKKLGVKQSVLIREAALARAQEVLGEDICPTCKRPHAA